MRIKFEKGLTPEIIGDQLTKIIRDKDLIIGSVNVYIQTYGEDGKAENCYKDGRYTIISPTDLAKERYAEDVAQIRRKRMKAV